MLLQIFTEGITRGPADQHAMQTIKCIYTACIYLYNEPAVLWQHARSCSLDTAVTLRGELLANYTAFHCL